MDKKDWFIVAAVALAWFYARRAQAGSGLTYNGAKVSEQQKAMLDAQDAAFSNTADYSLAPFVSGRDVLGDDLLSYIA